MESSPRLRGEVTQGLQIELPSHNTTGLNLPSGTYTGVLNLQAQAL